MFDIKFVVKTDLPSDGQLKITGSSPSLGQWDPSLALTLSRQHHHWQSPIIQIEQYKKFQFKIIMERDDGMTEWQILPNNSNRKFKAEYSCKLIIKWSSAQGSVSPLHISEVNHHQKKMQAQRIPLQKSIKNTHKQSWLKRSRQQFDPYKKAHEQDSTDSQDENEFFLVKRKMSDEIVMNSSDLEEIYNKSSAMEIYWDLLTKTKVYVVYSSTYQQDDPFYLRVKQQLSNISHKYHIKWIPQQFIMQDQKCQFNATRPKNEGSMFDIREQEASEQSLFSKSSFFIFVDVNTAIKAKQKIKNISSCLYANREQFQEIIESFDIIRHVDIICFNNNQQIENFCDFLKDTKWTNEQSLAFLEKYRNHQSIVFQQILQALKEKKDKELFTIETQQKYAESQAIKRINTPNTVTILDGHIFESSPQFCSKIIKNISRFSMVIIVTKGVPSQKLFKIGLSKNIVLVYDDFHRIRMEGNDYSPLRKCRENLQLLRMKIKLYLQNHGGSIVQRQSSIIYNLPEGRLELSNKIYEQLNQFITKNEIGRVSLKGTRLKINWNFATEARFLRTICQIKYLAFGPLGNFNIVSDMFGLRQLKDALKLLVEHHPSIFLEKTETSIRYFSYGKGKTATWHILPE